MSNILDLIDNAIAGATSPDAMRWTPDADKVEADVPIRVALHTALPDGFTVHFDDSPITWCSRLTVVDEPVDWSGSVAVLGNFSMTLTGTWDTASGRLLDLFWIDEAHRLPRGPRPLPIDGHAYRRRQVARRRRGR